MSILRGPESSAPNGARFALNRSATPAVALAPSSPGLPGGGGPLLLVLEAELYTPASGAAPTPRPDGDLPNGALARRARVIETTETLRASDGGWRSAPTDAGGVIPYPPILTGSLTVDRELVLDPGADGRTAAAWGVLRLHNEAGALDSAIATRNADARPVRIWAGRRRQAEDAALPPAALDLDFLGGSYGTRWTRSRRGHWRDPAWGELAQLLFGLGAGWVPDNAGVALALRDPGYWLERQFSGRTYAGTGGLEGTADMAGQRRPAVRGGTTLAPVRHVPITWVDPAALIAQVTDYAMTLVALYEGGDPGQITFGGDVADLYVGSTSPGQYRTDSARGLIQFGSRPARPITVDVVGSHPNGLAPGTVGELLRLLLLEDFGISAALLDADACSGLDAAWTHPVGLYIPPDDSAEAAALAGRILASAYARAVPTRRGTLRPVMLRAPAAGVTPGATYSEAEIIDVLPRSPGAPMDPPPYRWRVGHSRTNTILTSDIDPDATAAVRQALSREWATESASSTAVLAAWRRPSDPEIVPTALLSAAGAQALAGVLRDLWCVVSPRRVHGVVLPLSVGLRHEIGDWLRIIYPLPGLRAGALGQVVGESIQWEEGRVTLSVLA